MNVTWNNKRVILYGESMWCRDFYLKYSGILIIEKIIYCDTQSKWFLDDISSRVTCISSNKINYNSNDIIVLCSGTGKREEHDIELYSKGLVYGVDYYDSEYIEHYFLKQMKSQLSKMSVWIFGAGNNGKIFYENNKEDYNIKGFISNYDNENEFLGLPVVRLEELLYVDDKFIVICSKDSEIIEKQLITVGMANIRDFCTKWLLERELLVVWGSCQVYSIVDVLYKIEQFNEKYCCIAIFDSEYQECNHADKQRLYLYGNVCDVLFFNSEGLMSKTVAIADRYYCDSRKISIPFYYFRGQLIQVSSECNNYCLRYENKKSHFAFWFIGDEVINNMIEQNIESSEIIERISSIGYWDKEYIGGVFNKELKRVQVLDRISSLPIADFIQSNFHNMIVFKDGIHFCKELCVHLANQLGEMLGLDEISEEEKEHIISQTSNEDINCMPVYPCVLNALEMELPNKMYRYVHENGECEFLDFEQYEKNYINYVISVRNISKKFGIRII